MINLKFLFLVENERLVKYNCQLRTIDRYTKYIFTLIIYITG